MRKVFAVTSIACISMFGLACGGGDAVPEAKAPETPAAPEAPEAPAAEAPAAPEAPAAEAPAEEKKEEAPAE